MYNDSAKRAPLLAMASDAPPRKALSNAWAITAITIGSGLELYDSVVYNFFATLIGPLFFPVGNAFGQTLLSFATFGIGYVMRPLGGLVFGRYADRVGRKPAVILTLWLMGLSAMILVLAPSYAQIGLMAPVLVVLARLLQGFAIGGEMGPASAMLLEYADEHSRGFYTSWQPFSQGLAAVLAALVALTLSNLLNPSALSGWGWRIAFVIGIMVIPVSMIIRRRLEETLTPAHAKAATAGGARQLLKEHWAKLVASVLVMIGLASAVHIVVFYLPNYAVIQLHMPLSQTIWAGFVGSLILAALSPFSGWLSDRIGRRKVVFWSRVALVAMIYPAFVLLNAQPTLVRLLIVAACLAVPMAMTSAATLVLVSEVLPQRLRATGVAVSYYGAVVIFGSFSQFFSTILIHLTANANAPAFYVIGCGLVSLLGLAMVPETLGKRLS
ncbi:MFS transporter [Paraburkholderia tuberum]|uniref:Predicted arabinose efflux permease, MFS family n=1 Tax=Paraburkholderia tuberum TaxID=157910 RepID=A0A1H1KIZ5_9BURK|nr:Predicted arabinose efflux permease, MFS family [Paraburkholderia tuberum]